MPHASDAYESPYVTSMNYASQTHRHTPSRSPSRSPRHRSPHASPRQSPHASPRQSPHASPRQSASKYDSDSGDSSGSSADDHGWLGGYDKFIANLELSDSEPEEKHKKPKPAKRAKQTKPTKQTTPAVVRDVEHDPWKQQKKIILPEAEAALAEHVEEVKYEDQDPADYVDPDMYVSEDRPYKNLTNSAREALARLQRLAALGGDVEPSRRTPRVTPSARTPHVTPSRRTPRATASHATTKHARHINIQHPTPHATPRATLHSTLDVNNEDESPFIDTVKPHPVDPLLDDQSPPADEQNRSDPDDPRYEPIAEWDTRGSYSVGGSRRSPAATPSARTPAATPHRTPAARRHTPVYDVRQHETPVSIRNPDLLAVDSPFITHDLPPDSPAASHADSHAASPTSPVESEYAGETRRKPVEHSESPRDYTGGFGGAFATFGGAW
jgi:hypothetical protein